MLNIVAFIHRNSHAEKIAIDSKSHDVAMQLSVQNFLVSWLLRVSRYGHYGTVAGIFGEPTEANRSDIGSTSARHQNQSSSLTKRETARFNDNRQIEAKDRVLKIVQGLYQMQVASE